ncbi:MAG TPA: universal stress protein [Nitrososphaera sp.]|nr:universal stress protein [Nitrososphaera sp.]
MPKAILVPHDGYAMSDKALKYAIEIAKGLKMKIKLVRVVEEILDASAMSHWSNVERARVKRDIEKARATRREKEYKKLEQLISQVNSRGGVASSSSLVIEGDAAEKILLTIRKEKPYIVVIGSNRLKLRGLARIKALGSVARKLSEESSSPVLIVR